MLSGFLLLRSLEFGGEKRSILLHTIETLALDELEESFKHAESETHSWRNIMLILVLSGSGADEEEQAFRGEGSDTDDSSGSTCGSGENALW